MTAEKFQDAIGLLPTDLVAEADKKRRGKPRIIPWKRYAAMAACFVLVLSSAWFAAQVFAPRGAAENLKECAAEAAPMEQAIGEPAAAEPEAPRSEEAAPEAEESANGAESGGTDTAAAAPTWALPAADEVSVESCSVETPLKPSTACFGSPSIATLVTSRTELEAYLAKKDWMYDFTEARRICDGYDERWFEEKDLLLIAELAVPAGTECSVTAVTEEEGSWYICIGWEPQMEAERTEWHILLPLEKGQIPDAASVILVHE